MKKKVDRTELYHFLIKMGHFRREELELITDLLPNNVETLERAIYSRFGVGSYKSIIEEIMEDTDNE
jgi:hypothetical protein